MHQLHLSIHVIDLPVNAKQRLKSFLEQFHFQGGHKSSGTTKIFERLTRF